MASQPVVGGRGRQLKTWESLSFFLLPFPFLLPILDPFHADPKGRGQTRSELIIP
jgi:hypothetical protein